MCSSCKTIHGLASLSLKGRSVPFLGFFGLGIELILFVLVASQLNPRIVWICCFCSCFFTVD